MDKIKIKEWIDDARQRSNKKVTYYFKASDGLKDHIEVTADISNIADLELMTEKGIERAKALGRIRALDKIKDIMLNN